jgi:hypothetical protein
LNLRALSFLTSFFVAPILGCPEPADDDDGGPADTGPADTTRSDTGVADTGVPDTGSDMDAGIDLTRDPMCTQDNWVVITNGRLVDESGAGISAKAQVCVRLSPSGNQLCLRPSDSAADGSFSILSPPEARCIRSMVMRAVAPGTSYATSYCHVDVTGGAIVDLAEPVIFYDTNAPATLPPPGMTDQVRTVSFDDGLSVEFVPDQFFGEYAMLGSKRIPAGQRPCFLPAGETYDGLYAMTPEQDIDGAGFAMTIPNATGLAAGTTVDLFVLGGLFCELPGAMTPIEEGKWELYGSATVNGAGTMIEGGVLPCVNWFGYKAR